MNNPQLLDLFKNNDLEGFRVEYLKNYKKNVFTFGYIDFPLLEADPAYALPYVEFIMNENIPHYRMDYLQYLAQNGFSDSAILFLEKLKEHRGLKGRTNLCEELILDNPFLDIINQQKNQKVVNYLIENPVENWLMSTEASQHSNFVHRNLDYCLLRFYEMKGSVEFYVLDFMLSHPHLKDKVLAQLPSSLIAQKDSLNQVAMNYLEQNPSKDNLIFDHKSDGISKSLWLKHTLENQLDEKQNALRPKL